MKSVGVAMKDEGTALGPQRMAVRGVARGRTERNMMDAKQMNQEQ